MRDPKLALAIAIHQGACHMIAGGMANAAAVKYSKQAMESIVDGEVREEHGGLDVSLAAIEAEFANGRFYAGEQR